MSFTTIRDGLPCLRATFACAVFALSLMGCAGEDLACPFESDAACGPGYFRYSDMSCSVIPGGPSECTSEGDGKCYLECTSDDDCGGCAPYCRSLGLFNDGDFQCNRSVRVCRESSFDDCS